MPWRVAHSRAIYYKDRAVSVDGQNLESSKEISSKNVKDTNIGVKRFSRYLKKKKCRKSFSSIFKND